MPTLSVENSLRLRPWTIKRLEFSGEVPDTRVSSGLTAEYLEARERLYSLHRPSDTTLDRAWIWLLKWKNLLKQTSRWELPAPFLFANERGEVEMEWDAGHRTLMLRLRPSGHCEFLRTDDAAELEEEGVTDVRGVLALLNWLLAA